MLPATIPTLTGERVVLRPFRVEDAGLVQSVADDPLIPLITSVPTSGTLVDAQAFIRRQHDRLRAGAGYSFAIEERAAGRAVGQIGLWLTGIRQGRASAGYWIAPRFRRRGLAGVALSTLAEWALRLEEVHRLELYVEPWNEGSWRAAELAGFQREGLLRSWQQVGDARRDMFMYSRLRGD